MSSVSSPASASITAWKVASARGTPASAPMDFQVPKITKRPTTLVGRESTRPPVTSVVGAPRIDSGAGYLQVGVLRTGAGRGTLQSQTFIHELKYEVTRLLSRRASDLRKTTRPTI